ncbi:MAG: OmpA family protein [Nannocystaceae bacterium]
MKTSTFLIATLTLAGTAFGPSGCKKSQDTAEPTAEVAVASELDEGTDDEDPGQGDVSIDPELAKMCDLPEADFSFDSAKLSPEAKTALDALAACFVDGPAKDRRMTLVGHADPRGDEEYNLGLGQRRAGSVATYLGQKGLADERLETSSRGELDATGTDEASWARDRRVDIGLAD